MKVAVLRPDSEAEFLDENVNYDWIRERVGGHLESVPWWPNISKDVAYVDEDARLKQPRPLYNQLASILCNTRILGPMVIVGVRKSGSEWTDLSDEVEKEVKTAQNSLKTARRGW